MSAAGRPTGAGRLVGRAEQVPAIAGDIQEHGYLAIRFSARGAHELHAGSDHSIVVSSEVVDAQKESNPSGVLFSDDGFLAVAICAGEEQASLRAGRSHDDPPLRTAVSGC